MYAWFPGSEEGLTMCLEQASMVTTRVLALLKTFPPHVQKLPGDMPHALNILKLLAEM